MSLPFDRPRIAEKAKDLARSNNVLIGTSSWKYEGWVGQLYSSSRYEYRNKLAKTRFEANCLTEYAEVFPTVSVDAGYYQFPSPKYLQGLADQVPEGFRLSFKVTDQITMKVFPRQARHGQMAGLPNENFLNANLFIDNFLGPCAAIADKLGVLMFEFSHIYPGQIERGRDFIDQLGRFLLALPKGFQYGVEIRNKEFLRPEYFAMLKAAGVTHVFNNWTKMPPVHEQVEMADSFTTDFFAARFLLRPGRKYEEAVQMFSPYEKTQEENSEARTIIYHLTLRPTARPSYIFVNNRLEGNALQTIMASILDTSVNAK